MSKIFVVYGHHNIDKSFNQEVRDTFCSEAKKLGHEIDLINLHAEKPIPFYDGSEPSEQILDYRKRLEQCDVLFMISPCYNLRATAILENWIDLVLSNPDQKNIKIGKAGRSRWLGRRPHTRGVVMNPVDHPHGGGEGKSAGGRHPVSRKGQSAKGLKTRDNKRTDKFIIRRRKKKKG